MPASGLEICGAWCFSLDAVVYIVLVVNGDYHFVDGNSTTNEVNVKSS